MNRIKLIQICRFCLEQQTVAFPLTDTLKNIIESITPIKINIDQPIYNVLCVKCHSDLYQAYEILNRFQKGDIKLRELIEKGGDIQTYQTYIPKYKEQINRENGWVEVLIKEEFVEESSKIENEVINNVNVEVKIDESEVEDNDEVVPNEKIDSSHNEDDNSKNIVDILNDSKDTEDRESTGFDCQYCNKIFKTKGLLSTHEGLYHTYKDCEKCRKRVLSSSMKKHMRTHTQSTEFSVKCDICYKLISKCKIKTHYNDVHGPGVTCEFCGKNLRSEKTLKLHILRYHSNVERNFICDKCSKSFIEKGCLVDHIKRVHDKIRPYNCKYCDRSFARLYTMKVHERQHTNERPYICEICGETFIHNISLRTHRKSKHNIVEDLTATCSVCSKQFVSEEALRTHFVIKHG